jgi:DNA-binding transcriptional ArsR family regulator
MPTKRAVTALKTVGSSMPKNSISARYLEYLGAVSNPLRRDILKTLEGGAAIDTLQSRTSLDGETLEWHVDILQHA